MKFPKAVLILVSVFAVTTAGFVGFFVTAVRKRSVFAAICAALSAMSSVGIVSILEDYCRKASFSPRSYFSVNRAIDDFFSPDGTDDAV